MKEFLMTHLTFDTKVVFDENNPPGWLLSKEFKWWWDDYVLKLEIGENIDSDFQNIERIM